MEYLMAYTESQSLANAIEQEVDLQSEAGSREI
jgi:hypothetical protein